jgi:aspartate/methionine/tyrosine aminotransferase
MHVAHRLAGFGESIFARIARLAQQTGAVNLSQGFPDFDGPEVAKVAAIDAIRAGHSQYAPMTGVPILARAIADRWLAATGRAVDPASHVTVTCGCSEALTATLLGMLNPGDEVITFEPYFDFYLAGAAMAGAHLRCVTLHAPTRPGEPFRFHESDLRAAFTSRTRAILVNTPHNPTGKVFTRDELALIAELCARHNAIAITDEVYEELIYDPLLPHLSLATLPGMEDRTITLSSFGKTFSLTGWKVGWAIAPPPLSAPVRAAHQFMTFSGATPMQHGAAAALAAPGSYAAGLRALYADNRDRLAAALTRAGLTPHRSDSTYFLMADHSALARRVGVEGDMAMCEHLARTVGVAAIPPSVFYERKHLGATMLRFAFCKKRETIDLAIERLGALA